MQDAAAPVVEAFHHRFSNSSGRTSQSDMSEQLAKFVHIAELTHYLYAFTEALFSFHVKGASGAFYAAMVNKRQYATTAHGARGGLQLYDVSSRKYACCQTAKAFTSK